MPHGLIFESEWCTVSWTADEEAQIQEAQIQPNFGSPILSLTQFFLWAPTPSKDLHGIMREGPIHTVLLKVKHDKLIPCKACYKYPTTKMQKKPNPNLLGFIPLGLVGKPQVTPIFCLCHRPVAGQLKSCPVSFILNRSGEICWQRRNLTMDTCKVDTLASPSSIILRTEHRSLFLCFWLKSQIAIEYLTLGFQFKGTYCTYSANAFMTL